MESYKVPMEGIKLNPVVQQELKSSSIIRLVFCVSEGGEPARTKRVSVEKNFTPFKI